MSDENSEKMHSTRQDAFFLKTKDLFKNLPTLIKRMSPFPILGVLGVFFNFTPKF